MSASTNNLNLYHLDYLLDIYRERFDEYLQQGRYADDGEHFRITVQELIRMGLVRYEGHHFTTAEGTAYVLRILESCSSYKGA